MAKKTPETPETPAENVPSENPISTTTFSYQPLMQVGTTAGLKGLAEVMKSKIESMLPKHITPERMLKALFVAVSKTPQLLECTQESIVKSLMDASSLGLDCSGTLGSAYLVPFRAKKKDTNGRDISVSECQLIPGYRGLIDLARRGGEIAVIEAHVVYAQDKFDIEYGTVNKIFHKPYLGADRLEEYTGFYAVATFRDGIKQPEFMTVADVNKIKEKSKAKYGPWVDHFSEMARKTVVKRLCKYLPLSPELEQAIQIDNETSGGEVSFATVSIGGTEKALNRVDSLAGRLESDKQNIPDVAGETFVKETGEVIENDKPADDSVADVKPGSLL